MLYLIEKKKIYCSTMGKKMQIMYMSRKEYCLIRSFFYEFLKIQKILQYILSFLYL